VIPLRQWVNLFEITNRQELRIACRLLAVHGLPAGEHYDKQVNLLVKGVSYELRQPVALVRHGDGHALAIPADARLPVLEQQLTPHMATLEPLPGATVLDFARHDLATERIALAFLGHALRTPLWAHPNLWGTPRTSYEKQPLNVGDRQASVDVYPGFVWNLILTGDGRIFVSVDPIVRYTDRQWLSERMKGQPPGSYLGRHCLYHFGHQWFVVQMVSLTGLSVAEQRFVPDGDDQTVDVLAYTRRRWQSDMPEWVRRLRPDSPAIMFRHPGNERLRYGALELCKLTLSTNDAETSSLHRISILSPRERLRRTIGIVERYFQGAELAGQPIRVAPQPREIERRVFPVPAQRFGHDRVLEVRSDGAGNPDAVRLERLGRRRLELLLDPRAGPLDASPAHAQYVLQPLSLPRDINENFFHRLVEMMQRVSGRADYQAERVIYDDQDATSLVKQVRAIKAALQRAGVTRGYALLVLPENAKSDLHNVIKRELWPNVQFQCATAGKIRRFYEAVGQGWRVPVALDGKLTSFIRNCAMGLLIVNRKWPWALAAPLHYEVYIGIDVLNGMAGFTFVYKHGEQIIFRNFPCPNPERLTAAQMRDILVTHLTDDLRAFDLHPSSVIVQRDGQSFPSELHGWRLAMRQLRQDGLLAPDAVVGVVDIRKATADHLRVFEGPNPDVIENPTIGSYHVLQSASGIVTTTGRPFELPGTAKPLKAVIVEGPLQIDWVLEDLFAFSQLVFAAPDKCERLPITIKLNDEFLEPISADVDEEAALYDIEALSAADAVGIGGKNHE
jgi:hypothetical protein